MDALHSSKSQNMTVPVVIAVTFSDVKQQTLFTFCRRMSQADSLVDSEAKSGPEGDDVTQDFVPPRARRLHKCGEEMRDDADLLLIKWLCTGQPRHYPQSLFQAELAAAATQRDGQSLLGPSQYNYVDVSLEEGFTAAHIYEEWVWAPRNDTTAGFVAAMKFWLLQDRVIENDPLEMIYPKIVAVEWASARAHDKRFIFVNGNERLPKLRMVLQDQHVENLTQTQETGASGYEEARDSVTYGVICVAGPKARSDYYGEPATEEPHSASQCF